MAIEILITSGAEGAEGYNLIFNQMQHCVTDKQGRQYQLVLVCDSESLLIANLLHQNDLVGQAKCVFEQPDEMLIGDLIIVDDELLDRTKSRWQTLWQKVFKPKLTNYRNRGLGTCLLKFIIDYARSRGVKRIYGTITQQDVVSTPGLANWYKKHGFQIGPPTSEDPSKAVAHILHLSI